MPLVQRASGITYIDGAEDLTGGLTPPGPIRHYTLDLTIEYEPGDGFLLIWVAREDPDFSGDRWYGTLTAAEADAEESFGIGPERWIKA